MIKKIISFILRCRLENVMAVGVFDSAGHFLFRHPDFPHVSILGRHDFIFILLPVGILGLKSLLTLLATSRK